MSPRNKRALGGQGDAVLRSGTATSPNDPRRAELLELSRALLLTAVGVGIMPKTSAAARGFVQIARTVISEVDKPTPIPDERAKPSVSGDDERDGEDDGVGVDLSGLEELGV